MSAETPIYRYSSFFEDDGGMEKVKKDFKELGAYLIAEAEKTKREISKAYSLDDTQLLRKNEDAVSKLAGINKLYADALKEIEALEKRMLAVRNEAIKAALDEEKVKQAKLKTAKAEADAERATAAALQAANNEKKSAIALNNAATSATDRNTKATRQQKDAYGEMSAELNFMFRRAASLAVQMYRLEQAGHKASNQYKTLENEFKATQVEALKLDKALKKIDASLGRHQRNVGNYQTDKIGMALQQILREGPSAAVSLNTFFLAISNNLPIFFDALAEGKREIKELKDAVKVATDEIAAANAIKAEATKLSALSAAALETEIAAVTANGVATKEQEAALRAQIAAHTAEIETTGTATAATIANTEQALINAGATSEQVASVQKHIKTLGAQNIALGRATQAQTASTAALQSANSAMAGQQSNLQRIIGSLFSVQTLLTAGVIVLTLWGAKIIEVTKSLFGANAELEKFNERQDKFNKAQFNGIKNAQEEILELRKYLAVVKDRNLTDEERQIALKKLRSQYPLYFKNLTDEQILLGKTTDAQKELMTALEKRKEVEEKTSLNVENKQHLLDLQAEREKLLEANEKLRKAQIEISKATTSGAGQGAAGIAGELGKNLVRLNEIQEASTVIQKKIIQNDSAIFKLKKETIKLEGQLDKDDDKNRLKQIKSIDYLASKYQRDRAEKQGIIDLNTEVANSERFVAEVRIKAREDAYKETKKLAKLDLDEQLRVLKKTYNEEYNAEVKTSDGKIKMRKYTNEALQQLTLQYQYDTQKANIEYQNKLKQADLAYQKESTIQILEYQKAKLLYDQSYFSSSEAAYAAYVAAIAEIDAKLQKITNPLAGRNLDDETQITENQIKKVRAYRAELEKLLNGRNFGDLNFLQQNRILKKLEEFEKKREATERNYATQRLINRKKQIEDEQALYTTAESRESQEFKTLEKERQDIILELENNALDERLRRQKEFMEKMKKLYDYFIDILGQAIDKMIEKNQKAIEKQEDAIDKQNDLISKQEERARAGLDNTLAYEQKQLAKREAELAKSQRKQERLEKIKALYSSYANYASKGEENALLKAIRDFAALEAITATFKHGGIVGKDGYTNPRTNSNGITIGRSHAKGGGIPALFEGGEGFISRKGIANIGEDTFYEIKTAAERGTLGENFFTEQGKDLARVMQPRKRKADNTLTDEVRKLRKAVEDKPDTRWDLVSIVNGVITLMETEQTKNKTVRNLHKTRKPRLNG